MRFLYLAILIFSINYSYLFAYDAALDAKDLVDSKSAQINANFVYGKQNEVPNYSDNPEQLKYTNSPDSIKQDSFDKSNNDDVSKQVKYDFVNRPNFKVSGNEDFLLSSKGVLNNPTEELNIISSSYDECSFGDSVKSCLNYAQNSENICVSNRIIDIAKGHQYTCNKNRYPYQISCSQQLHMRCTGSSYRFPKVISNSIPGFRYDNHKIYYSTPRIGQNCNGHRYYFSFHLDSVDQVEEFVFESGGADDRTQIIINDNMVHNYPNRGCEWGGYRGSSPNINLRSYLKVGTNMLEIRIIVGGLGNANGVFRFKYKECDQFEEDLVESCSALRNAEDVCVIKESTCTEPNESRNIDGFNVTRSCWAYDIQKLCTTKEYEDHCKTISDNNECSQLNSICTDKSDDGCMNYENKYICSHNINIQESDHIKYSYTEDVSNEHIDNADCKEFDSVPNCSYKSQICLDSGTKNILGIEISRDCWKYEKKYVCGGDNCNSLGNSCSFNGEECLLRDSDGVCVKSKKEYVCGSQGTDNADILFCGSQTYCSGVDCEEIEYKKDQDFVRAASTLAVLEEAAGDFESDALSTFSGENNYCEKSAFGFSNCCKSGGWGQEASLASCNESERKLAAKNREKACHYVGQYCSDEEDLTNTCLKKRNVYCCFSSKLSRIIHEQSRPQLGRGWGVPQAPDCSGISIGDFEKLNFKTMDFSEYVSDINQKVSLPDTNQQIIETQRRMAEFYNKKDNEN